jgi:hypothetical protein
MAGSVLLHISPSSDQISWERKQKRFHGHLMLRVASSFRYIACVWGGSSLAKCETGQQSGGGLLTGPCTDQGDAAAYYSTKLDIHATRKFIADHNNIYNAMKEAEMDQIANCAKRAVEFAGSNELYDRKELIGYVNTIVNGSQGKLVCLLGGKSTGKSKLVSVFNSGCADAVVAVDCRSDTNLATGILRAIAAKSGSGMEKLQSAVTAMLKEDAPKSAASIALGDVLKLIVENVDGTVTIIIDEANLALETEGSQDAVAATRRALALFTFLTKQERKVL